jgi:hypothetical protein
MVDDPSDKKDSNGLLGDTLKRVFTAGVTAAFMTEESVRAYLQDLKLPKEVLSLLLQQANKSKEEISARVSKEIVNMLNKVDYTQEISRFVENHKFRVSAEIEIVKKHTHDKSHVD